MSFARFTRSVFAVGLTLTWSGCSDNGHIVGTVAERYELPSGGAGGTSPEASGGSDQGPEGTGTGGGASLICAGDSRMTCTVPVDCEVHRCGAPDSSFDASGCLRRYCSGDAECLAGERCVSVAEQTAAPGASLDDCAQVWVSCEMDSEGKCGCFGQMGCTGYCAAR